MYVCTLYVCMYVCRLCIPLQILHRYQRKSLRALMKPFYCYSHKTFYIANGMYDIQVICINITVIELPHQMCYLINNSTYFILSISFVILKETGILALSNVHCFLGIHSLPVPKPQVHHESCNVHHNIISWWWCLTIRSQSFVIIMCPKVLKQPIVILHMYHILFQY